MERKINWQWWAFWMRGCRIWQEHIRWCGESGKPVTTVALMSLEHARYHANRSRSLALEQT